MRLLLALPFLAAACASPAPGYFGATRSDLTLGGIGFTVWLKEDSAEVYRRGYLRRAERAQVPALMVEAAERASGCRVRPGTFQTGLPGDSGEARMALDC